MAWVKIEMEVHVTEAMKKDNGCAHMSDEEYVEAELLELGSSFLHVEIQNVEEVD
jgi:hypothetical protein